MKEDSSLFLVAEELSLSWVPADLWDAMPPTSLLEPIFQRERRFQQLDLEEDKNKSWHQGHYDLGKQKFSLSKGPYLEVLLQIFFLFQENK